jgi:hypothetical protein
LVSAEAALAGGLPQAAEAVAAAEAREEPRATGALAPQPRRQRALAITVALASWKEVAEQMGPAYIEWVGPQQQRGRATPVSNLRPPCTALHVASWEKISIFYMHCFVFLCDVIWKMVNKAVYRAEHDIKGR